MKAVLLHGLGQTPKDWEGVLEGIFSHQVECPDLFSLWGEELTYKELYRGLERRYRETGSLKLSGLSLGATLALDFATCHPEKVASLLVMAPQIQGPRLLLSLQNLVFRSMPEKSFEKMGLSKENTISLCQSMKSLNLTSSLKNLTCPVTILLGEKDIFNLPAAKKLSRILPQSKLHIIPGAGHEINKDAPEVVREFLGKEW